MEDFFVNIGGYRLHYYAIGQGRPVLLLHGWGCDGTFLFHAAQSIAETCRCYIPDLPGFGQSPEAGEYGIEDYAKLMLSFLDSQGIEKTGIVAHSFGGRIALLLAANAPERIDRICITGGAGLIKKRTAAYYAKVWTYKLGKKLSQVGWISKCLKLFGVDLQEKARNAGSADYRALSPEMKKVFVRVVNTDLHYCLKKVVSPTLLVWGDQDTETPMSFAKTMEKEISDAALVVFENCGHFAYLEQSGRFAAILQSYFGGN